VDRVLVIPLLVGREVPALPAAYVVVVGGDEDVPVADELLGALPGKHRLEVVVVRLEFVALPDLEQQVPDLHLAEFRDRRVRSGMSAGDRGPPTDQVTLE